MNWTTWLPGGGCGEIGDGKSCEMQRQEAIQYIIYSMVSIEIDNNSIFIK